LRELRRAEEALEVQQQKREDWTIPSELLELLKQIGPRLPELWQEPYPSGDRSGHFKAETL